MSQPGTHKMSKKIVIIGAGPIGCYAAQLLKIYGYDPLLIEEHSQIGRPLHCTGLVGHRVFEEKRPFPLPAGPIINTINGAIIHCADQHFAIERKGVAYVIDREKFDKELSGGLRILHENRFLGVEHNGGGYTIETDKDELSADIVIAADGATSTARKLLNKNSDNVIYSKGVQLRIRMKPAYKDFVEVYLKEKHFFWVVPEKEDIVRVGTISENPHKDLQNFLKEIKLKGEILDRFGGIVATGICGTTVSRNMAIVGDAACQLKPISYGGIYFGLKAASILTSCIKDNRLNDYDSLWKKELAFEIKIGLKAREIYNRLDSLEVNEVFRLLKDQKSIIEHIGDFENHSHLILEIFKKLTANPQIGKLIAILFPKIL